jgi:putative component of toxin-antitoxin plasmid stabilization module
VGGGVEELRIGLVPATGSITARGSLVVILLCGGTKERKPGTSKIAEILEGYLDARVNG